MPSSLTKVLPLALVFSTHLPVSVCGTGSALQRTSTFSRLPVPVTSAACAAGIMVVNHLPPQSTQGLTFPRVCGCAPRTGTGILTSCPSTTPLGLALGPTNPTRTDLPSETLDFRRRWFSHLSRYSCQHPHFQLLQYISSMYLHRHWNAPLPCITTSRISVQCLSPVTLFAQLRLTSELLRTL